MKWNNRKVSRRKVLRATAGAAIGLGLGPLARAHQSGPGGQDVNAFRFVFMPCIHFRYDLRSSQGLAMALEEVHKLDPKPAFILTGGDVIHNIRDDKPDDAAKRIEAFLKVWQDNTDLTVHHAMGNHEMTGWGTPAIPRDHPEGGYKLPMRMLGMKDLSYSFDHGGWHFVVAHNVSLLEQGKFTGRYEPQVLEFVRNDLAQNKDKPTIMVGHVPIVTVTEFFDGRAALKDNVWSLDAGRLVGNPHEIVKAMDLGNVKLALSGHIHRYDDIRIFGKRFICSGSVSGAQWRGPDHETRPGFGIADLRADGNFDYRYYDYGWTFE